jgi:superfamily II DNA or RNA helicase
VRTPSLPTPFTEAISTLNDRALRRLLGARAFLRGYDYVRRHAVDDIKIEEASARGQVRGTDPAPYQVAIQLTPPNGASATNGGSAPWGGFSSECTCPTFSKINGHCKHVAALLIALRDQVRGPAPRPQQQQQAQPQLQAMPHTQNGGGYSSASPLDDFGGGSGGGRRGRRSRAARALKMAAAARAGGAPQRPGGQGFGGGSGPFHGSHGVQSGSVSTGVDAWLPEPAPPMPKTIEYRLQVRAPGSGTGQGGSAGAGGSLTITLLDPNARTPLLPSALLFGQGQTPTADREAVRLLARFENEGPRRVGIEVRGEDASDLLPLLKGRRVIVEPQMMELRFGDESLRPRFDLELSPDGTRILVKSCFVRPGDPRKFTTAQGAWFEGSPGWYVDAQEGVARPIDRRVAPAAIRRLLRAPFIHEPIENLPQLIAQGLPKVALEVGAELPDLSQVADVVDLVPTFRMRAGGTLTEARVSLRAAYEDVEMEVRADGMTPPVIVKAPPPPPAGSPRPGEGGAPVGPRPRARCIRCDIAAQQDAAAKLRDLGLVPDEDGNGFVVRGDDAIQFWTEGIGQLPEEWDLFVPDDLVDVNVRTETLTANARVSSGVDWLSLRLSFEAEGIAVSQEELGKCLAEGRRYVRLADGSFARLDAQKVRDVLQRQAEILATGGGQGGKLPLSQAGRLQELLEQVGKSVVSDTTRELFAKLRDVDEIKGTKKPRNLKASLRPYQEQGFHWLWFLHEIGAGGVLADDMGLGKTVQTLALLLAVKAADEKAATGRAFKALIVAPTSVVTNWLREMDKFAPSLKHALWHGGDRKERTDELEDADVVVTSYALLRRDEELLAKLDLRYAILDEAQQIKNPLSATARAAKRLKADRRLALTGTPIENRLSEIWSIFDYVSPGLLGPLDKFEERYSRPIDNGDQKAATRLRATIHPFILRRTKSEVAKDLPEKIETEQYCELTGEQASLYAAVLKEVRAQVMGEVERQGLARSHIQILAGLTRLRQAACDPRLLNLPRKFEDEDSGKLVALRELIQTCVDGGHRVLVFSQFVSMLTIIRRAMEEDGVPYEYLDGSTKDRAERVENFQRDTGPPVFLISLKAGGSGLNLTAADTVIHFDPWWNPAVEDQATDRTHRIGQTKVVTAYRLVAKGTIEEKILELGGKKRELVGAVLSEDAGGAKKLTKTDLEDLFRFDE